MPSLNIILALILQFKICIKLTHKKIFRNDSKVLKHIKQYLLYIHFQEGNILIQNYRLLFYFKGELSLQKSELYNNNEDNC